MMPSSKSVVALFALAAGAGPSPGHAQPPSKMTFRNNLVPGHLTKHRLERVIRRTSKRPSHIETLTYTKRSDWVQCNIDESRPGQVKVYQMMTDRATKVNRVFHDDKRVKPTPEAAYFNLLRGSTSLQDTIKTPRDASIERVPHTEKPEQAVLGAMLDFAHWPKKRVDAGHTWQRAVDVPGFSGSQTLVFVGLGKLDDRITAQVTVLIEGEFTGELAGDHVFDKAQAVVYWSRLDQTLVKMEGQAFYAHRQGTVDDEYELRLTVELTGEKLLGEAAQSEIASQLNAFANALTRLQGGDKLGAVRACRSFVKRWPKSVWMPAIESLERRASYKKKTVKRLSTKAFRRMLVKAVVAWEAAADRSDHDLLERTRRALQVATRDYRAKLQKMIDGRNDGDRARGIFALAFSSRPADLARIQRAAGDSSVRVRASAFAGIAARRSPDTSPKVLLAGLSDDEPAVRRRACDAVAACIPREHPEIVAFVRQVAQLMSKDKAAGVRRAAVRTVAAIGSRADIAALETAADSEPDESIRDEIQRAIETIRKRP